MLELGLQWSHCSLEAPEQRPTGDLEPIAGGCPSGCSRWVVVSGGTTRHRQVTDQARIGVGKAGPCMRSVTYFRVLPKEHQLLTTKSRKRL